MEINLPAEYRWQQFIGSWFHCLTHLIKYIHTQEAPENQQIHSSSQFCYSNTELADSWQEFAGG